MKTIFQTTFDFAGRKVGYDAPVLIIAEAGVAHFGDPERMDALIDLAVEAGADVFKTQAFMTNEMISATLPEWRERMQPKEVQPDFLLRAKARCDEKGIIFLCTPHDNIALDWLDDMDVCGYKIGSGEKGNTDFIRKVAERGKPIFVSTGMHEEADIQHVLDVIAKTGQNRLALFHCVTSYPIPENEVNLLSVPYMAKKFPVPVGYSDHTEGHTACLGAVALGACMIEKHITLEFNIPNAQDWKVSAGPDDLASLVQDIRRMESMRGVSGKTIQPCEQAGMKWALKRLVAIEDLPAGTILSDKNLKAKRAATGVFPDAIDVLSGQRLRHAVLADTPVLPDDLEQ